MGTSYTPKYRVEYRDQKGWSWMGWPQGAGRACQKNVDQFRQDMNKSFLKGGVNEKNSEILGFVPWISELRLVRQSDNKVMYVSKAPMFEVV